MLITSLTVLAWGLSPAESVPQPQPQPAVAAAPLDGVGAHIEAQPVDQGGGCAGVDGPPSARDPRRA